MGLTVQQAFSKIKHYCAYQERCHSDVRARLFSYGLTSNETDEILSDLIAENYLNEERFAIQFAGGKFRQKKWGRNKITEALKLKQVSTYCIKKALQQIDNADYLKTFYKIADNKIRSLKDEKNIFIKKRKLRDHLLQKGFEMHLIHEILNDL